MCNKSLCSEEKESSSFPSSFRKIYIRQITVFRRKNHCGQKEESLCSEGRIFFFLFFFQKDIYTVLQPPLFARGVTKITSPVLYAPSSYILKLMLDRYKCTEIRRVESTHVCMYVYICYTENIIYSCI